jgi:Ca2+-binding EF-hand superfamily protein
MNRFNKILLPIALLFACDPADAVVADEVEAEANVESVAQAPEGTGRGRMAKLDADKDGAISLTEAKGTRLADKFTALDRDSDGKLTREELRAMKGMKGTKGDKRGEGRHAGKGGHMKDPAARATKMLERRDADKNGALSLSEVQGSRLADKFAMVDTDKDGSLAREELTAMKGRGGKAGEGHHDKDPGARAAKLFEKRDADNSGSLSAAELQGSRMSEKFAAIDADKDGSLTRDELVAFKAAHGERGERGPRGPRGDRGSRGPAK